MKIGIATDHNGVIEKQEIINKLQKENIKIVDYSPVNTPTDDYPDFAYEVCKGILNEEINLGILLCGTGIGMSIAANKIKGIRCAKVANKEEAMLARNHNNANVIALSYKENIEDIIVMVESFINATFSDDERHHRRVDKITKLEGLE